MQRYDIFFEYRKDSRFSHKKRNTLMGVSFLLSYLDSNQDKLIQSQMCYRYTIGQSVCFLP